jgi:hypothetical protein
MATLAQLLLLNPEPVKHVERGCEFSQVRFVGMAATETNREKQQREGKP